MTEQTNLSKTALSFEPEGLVDDATGDPIVPTTDQPKDESDVEQTETSAEKIKIKYLGADEEYTLDEIKTLAQKGRNYDKVQGKLESLEKAEERQILLEMATESGFKDIPSYVKSLKETTYKTKLEEKINDYLDQGLPSEHAKRLAEVDLAARPKVEDPIQKSFEELFNEFPDETKDFKNLSDFPQEVQDLIAQGKSPIVAYSKFLAKQGEETRRIAKQNEENAKRDTGSLGTASTDKEDAFLKGFLGR